MLFMSEPTLEPAAYRILNCVSRI